jgi:hypothetical protein
MQADNKHIYLVVFLDGYLIIGLSAIEYAVCRMTAAGAKVVRRAEWKCTLSPGTSYYFP